MSLQEFENVINQLLFEVLEGLNRSSRNHHQLSKMYEKLQNFCLSNHLENSTIFKKIQAKVVCVVCKATLGYVLLSCNHFICRVCLKNTVLSESEGLVFRHRYEQELKPKCPIQGCPLLIDSVYYEELFREDSEKLLKLCRKREIKAMEKINNKHFCFICEKLRKPEHFFYDCRHVCVFCTAFDMNRSSRGCSICYQESLKKLEPLAFFSLDEAAESDSIEFLQHPSKTFVNSIHTIRCNRCGDDQIFEHLFLEACQDFILCLHCLKLFWLEVTCKKCLKPIQTHESFDMIRKHLFKKCEICENCVPFDFILPLFCCSSIICMFCQVTFNLSAPNEQKNSCLNCKEFLELHLIESLDNLTD